MIYQVRANLFFDIQDEANDFYHDCQLALLKSTMVNPDSENTEFATIELIENYHDENPNQPCSLLKNLTNQPNP